MASPNNLWNGISMFCLSSSSSITCIVWRRIEFLASIVLACWSGALTFNVVPNLLSSVVPCSLANPDSPSEYNILNGPHGPSFVIIEPVIGAGGVYEHKPEVFEVLKKWQDSGGIVIFGETITGFGKLGTMFAFEKYDFKNTFNLYKKLFTNLVEVKQK